MAKIISDREKFTPPLPWTTLDKYVKGIFTPIRNGECVTTIWTRMAGRRMRNKFVLENIHLFSDQIGDMGKYLLVYIEPLDLTESSAVGYLRLIGNSILAELAKSVHWKDLSFPESEAIFKQAGGDYSKLLSQLKELLQKLVKEGVEVVLFLGEFDELEFADTPFYNNLKSVWYSLQPHLHYVFLLMSNVESESMYLKYRDLIEVLRQNIIYVPLLDEQESEYVLEHFYQKYGIAKGQQYTQMLLRLCGGHPNLLKICTRNLAEWTVSGKAITDLEDMLLNHYEAISVCRTIYDSLGANSKASVQAALSGTEVNSESNLAFKLGLVRKDKSGKLVLFGQIFHKAISSEIEKEKQAVRSKYSGKLEFDNTSGNILIGGEVVDNLFTRQEYELLMSFLKEPNKLKTRDDIGAVLWGDHAYEKYSDWAIDQIISKLRKKLEKLGLSENVLLTLRGRGYKINI